MSFLSPLQEGFGGYLGRFYAQLAADTPAMAEYIQRGLSKSIVWAPGRMIDSVEEMLAEWRKNDNDNAPSASAYLPVMIVAMSKDYSPSMADWGTTQGEAIDVMIPGDEHERAFKLRQSAGEYRCQIAIISPESHTAHSLAMQLNLWTNSGEGGRRFKHVHKFAGHDHEFPAVLEQIEIGSMDTKAEQKNITILLADINLRATIPLFQAPKPGENNDGKPAPAGYPVVLEVNTMATPSRVSSQTRLEGDKIVMEFNP